MSDIKRVVIVEDQQLIRDGLRLMLSTQNNLKIVGEAADGLQAIHCVKRLKPDLLLLDLSMPRLNGFSVVKELRGYFPELKILVLTIHTSEERVSEAFKAGANGYCIKDSGMDELLMAINHLLSGKTFISAGITNDVMKGYLLGRESVKKQSKFDKLTQREREVLKLVAESYNNKEIADFLCISAKTVEKHRSNIMNKLELHNAAALIAYAVKKNIALSEM